VKPTVVVGTLFSFAVVAIWIILLTSSNEMPELLPSLSGCYISQEDNKFQKILIERSGILRYGKQLTEVTVYEDKQSLSFFPKRRVSVGKDGTILFDDYYPLLLRIDRDRKGFTVLGDHHDSLVFRRIQNCKNE
jgi:hypothetical protein